MVRPHTHPGLLGASTTSVVSSRHRWHHRPWPHLRLRRSIVATLVRLDDDPVLLCDCAEGAPHTCG